MGRVYDSNVEDISSGGHTTDALRGISVVSMVREREV